MTPREALRFGFTARCLLAGMTLDQTKQAAEKAAGLLDTALGAGVGLATGATHSLGSMAVPLALAGPPVAGALAGYGAAQLNDVGDDDVEAIRDREVINTYKTEADKLRHLIEARQRSRTAANATRIYRP